MLLASKCVISMHENPIILMKQSKKKYFLTAKFFSLVLLSCLLSIGSMHVLAASDATVDATMKQAQDLISAGDYATAYQLLLPFETQMAGDVPYDLLLGTAAVESQHYSQGMFALERVVAVDPDNAVAREKIAKAHFYLGEVSSSKMAFNQLLNQNPSEETAKAIEKYLSAIDKAMGLSTTFSAYLEAGAGWDSNVNSATSADSIAVPFFGGLNFPIIENARKKSDSFLNLLGGAGFRVPATSSLAYIGNLQFAKKLNQDYQQFETGSIDLNLGIQFKQDNDVYSLALQDDHFYVDDDAFRHAYGATVQWQSNFDPFNQASLYGQYSKLEYDDNAIRDANRYVLGANYAHVFTAETHPVVYLGAYYGQEDTTKTGVKFLDQSIYGLRAGGQLTVVPNWLAYVSAGYELRDYQAEDPAFLKKRQDNQYDLTLGVNYQPARNWFIKPQISLMKNDSNIGINAFDRTTMSINIRRELDG